MLKARTFVGLDVHAAKVVAACLDALSGEVSLHSLRGESEKAVKLCRSLPGPISATYEAGPTGYGLARSLEACGIGYLVAAPGKIPRAPTDHLVRLLVAGKLHPVRVPATEEDALRDLVRAREDVRGDLMRARHRLSKLLLRHDVRYAGSAWTAAHHAWLATVDLGHPPDQATLADYRGAVDALTHRRSELEGMIEAAIGGSPWPAEVALLRCLRGIDTLLAVGLCAEIGDFRRFARAGSLMSYLAWCPASTPPASRAGSARSRSRAPATPADCWSRPPGTTAALPASASVCAADRSASRRRLLRSRGPRSSAFTASGSGCAGAASARR